MNYTTLLTSLENNILTITINRPDKLNALNRQVFVDLDAIVDEIESNDKIKSAIITGSGSKAFVAGADIAEFSNFTMEEAKQLSSNGHRVFKKIELCTKPIVAAINGFALGGGCELAMACHFRIAAENAKFGQPEVNLGLIPGYGGTQRLVQLIGKGKAMQLLLSAEMINAQEAYRLGLVNEVTAPENLLSRTAEILTVINTKAPLALAACIQAANAVFDETKNGYEVEASEFGKCFGTADMKEGTTAFIEKRKALFTGK